MKNFKSHFVFNRSQQNGIFLLVTIIVGLQLLYFFTPFSSEDSIDPKEQRLVEELQRSVDSLKNVATKKDSLQIKHFNPNFISDYKGYILGMSPKEIDRLHAFREKGLWVNSSEEFREVTGVSDSLLKNIVPYFKFPDWKSGSVKNKEVLKNTFSAPVSKQDLNSTTAEELRLVHGIGEKLSARIVKYRENIGGFRDEIQVQDVYGLSPEVIQRLLHKFEVRDRTLAKLSLNSVTVVELSELPYFNYELARKVVTYRISHDSVSSFEELQQIKGFPVEKIDRIKLYLTID